MQANTLSKRQQEQLKELNEKMSAEIMELMQQHTLPAEFIHESFQQWLSRALPHETAKLMATSYADFKKFWLPMWKKGAAELNLWEMGFAINCVESKGMEQLRIETPEGYIAVQDAITQMAIHWNAVVNKVKEPITSRYKTLMDRVKDNKPIIMPDTAIVH